jgi:hypothetical protein
MGMTEVGNNKPAESEIIGDVVVDDIAISSDH